MIASTTLRAEYCANEQILVHMSLGMLAAMDNSEDPSNDLHNCACGECDLNKHASVDRFHSFVCGTLDSCTQAKAHRQLHFALGASDSHASEVDRSNI